MQRVGFQKTKTPFSYLEHVAVRHKWRAVATSRTFLPVPWSHAPDILGIEFLKQCSPELRFWTICEAGRDMARLRDKDIVVFCTRPFMSHHCPLPTVLMPGARLQHEYHKPALVIGKERISICDWIKYRSDCGRQVIDLDAVFENIALLLESEIGSPVLQQKGCGCGL